MTTTRPDQRALAQRLLAGRAARSPSPVAAAAVQPRPFVDDTLYAGIRAQRAELQRLGVENPFARGHEGVSGPYATVQGRKMSNFSGYNYIGLSGHPEVTAAAKQAVDEYGTSSSASRVASGELRLHRALETAIADFVGAEAALAFNGGFLTNAGVIGHMVGPRDAIFHDELIHASALTGAKLSGARRQPFPHNDLDRLEAMLRQSRHHHERALIVVEGVYSMDGDIPDLPRLIALKSAHDAGLMVDEAHSIGVLGATGRGICEHFGVVPAGVDLLMGTLSKSFASCGGYVAGSAALMDYLRFTAPAFVYSCGMSPPDAAAALAALTVLRREPDRVERLRANSALFLNAARARGLDTGPSGGSPVVPVITGSSVLALKLAERMVAGGTNVHPILHPAVEDKAARLRFFICEGHDEAQLTEAADRVAADLAALRREPVPTSAVFGGAHA